MDPKVSLEQLLAAVPQQRLDQKVGDAHLAEISRDLTNWKSVCTNLGISEAEEKAIEEENKEVDVRRYLHRPRAFIDRTCVCVAVNYAGRHNRTQTTSRRSGRENSRVNHR